MISTRLASSSHARSLSLAPQRPTQWSSPRRVTVPSSNGSDVAPEGQVSQTLMRRMEASIQEALQAKKVLVKDVYGDGRHVAIEVVSDEFEGKTSMQRQRMVYKSIWMELQEAVHAVDSMVTDTSAERKQTSLSREHQD